MSSSKAFVATPLWLSAGVLSACESNVKFNTRLQAPTTSFMPQDFETKEPPTSSTDEQAEAGFHRQNRLRDSSSRTHRWWLYAHVGCAICASVFAGILEVLGLNHILMILAVLAGLTGVLFGLGEADDIMREDLWLREARFIAGCMTGGAAIGTALASGDAGVWAFVAGGVSGVLIATYMVRVVCLSPDSETPSFISGLRTRRSRDLSGEGDSPI